ncbi:MAG: hypothetical protein ACLPKB_27780 [Xanthobacteraceae bacterium]
MKAVAVVGVAILALVGVSAAFGQSSDLGYFCVTEFAGGVAYNPNQQKWEGRAFSVDWKFVARLKFVANRFEKGQAITDYTVSITKIGGYSYSCDKPISIEDPRINLGAWDEKLGNKVQVQNKSFKCLSGFGDYSFNLKTKRFLATVISSDYVDGRDGNGETTPVISGGTCTRFD